MCKYQHIGQDVAVFLVGFHTSIQRLLFTPNSCTVKQRTVVLSLHKDCNEPGSDKRIQVYVLDVLLIFRSSVTCMHGIACTEMV